MFDRLSLVTPPAIQAVSLEEVRRHLVVTHNDDDLVLDALREAAIGKIDGPDGIGYCMEAQTWRLSLDCFPREIRIPLRPVASVTSITYVDPDEATQTLAASGYRVGIAGGSCRIWEAPNASWPALADVPNAVEVTFVAGTGAPMLLKVAVLQMIAHWYEHRAAAMESAPSEVPMAARHIINGFRGGRVAA